MKLSTKNKRRIFDAISFVFWLAMFLMLRKVRFKWEENPILVSIIITGLIIHLFIYQSRLSKLKKRKLEIKSNNINAIKKETQLSLDRKALPTELSQLKDMFEKWGVQNDLLREDLYENTTRDELLELKNEIEPFLSQIESFLKSEQNTSEYQAVLLTHQAYNDLGLWTWEKDNAHNSK